MTQDDQDGAADRAAIRVALAALAALAIAMGIGRFAFTPILPMMLQDAGLTVSDGGWLASANYLGYLIGALSAVRLRMRAATAIRAGLAVIGLSTLGMSLREGFLLWLVLRTVAGVASAWVLVFVSAWSLERLAALGRLGLSGVVYAGVGAGIVLAGLACLAGMSSGASSSAAWAVLGLASLAAAAVVWPAFGSGGAAAGSVLPRNQSKRAGGFWRLVICYGAYGFGYIIPGTFLPVMAKQIVSDPLLFGWAWPVFGAAAVASTLLVARMAPFVTHRGAWAASHWVMAAGVVVPLLLPGLAGILVAALCVGGTFVVITQVGMQEARAVAGEHARTLIAAMTSAFALGQIVGPLAAAYWVRATGGFSGALILAAALLALSAVALMRGSRGGASV
ncbi:MAG TPA: YbfB/YjiJ family MFS transporter [Burkholderiales bacterium]|nr:YbfB/YjiJ family MFS transporter [Burkholderiales bacterium]